MTAQEKATLKKYLEPRPRWFSRLLGTIFKTGEIAQSKEQLESDYGGGIVEVLTVGVKRLAVGEECDDEEPILLFEVGQNELLLLWGQWLYDPHVVATEHSSVDELGVRNAWFKHFELVRSPLSGLVLSLKSIGRETVSSVGTVGAGQRLPAQPSRVFQGNLDALVNGRPVSRR